MDPQSLAAFVTLASMWETRAQALRFAADGYAAGSVDRSGLEQAAAATDECVDELRACLARPDPGKKKPPSLGG